MKRTAWIVLAVVAAGLILRSLRLAWQPIWWDEGYSIYFATEPLGRMAWLTARDIHPPLYYALLHGWTAIFGPSPERARVLSILLGAGALPLIYLLGRALFPHRPRTAWFGLLLLVFSPIHLYYSQEIRMYGLAVTLGLGASYALWRWVAVRSEGADEWRGWGWLLGYLAAGSLALYTLYYAALLLCAQAIWALVRLRKNLRAAAALVGVYLLLLLLYLPWLAYAVPQLVGYVGGKVQSDQDVPLGPLAYIERHLVAFTAGQVRLNTLPAEWLALAPATLAICAIILGLVLVQTLQPGPAARSRAGGPRGHMAPSSRRAPAAAKKQAASGAASGAANGAPEAGAGQAAPAGASGAATAALWTWLAVPVALGWLINLRLPFFPPGGERLLLMTLPYLLLLLAFGIDLTWRVAHLGKLAAVALAVNAAIGFAAFYTTPRYAADDYRPLIRQMVQQGDDRASFLAIFPWQVGYWRAYSPFGLSAEQGAEEQAAGLAEPPAEPGVGQTEQQAAEQAGSPGAQEVGQGAGPGAEQGAGLQAPVGPGPRPLLLSDGAVEWSPVVQEEIDAALAQGTVWFPAPLTFGSSLPPQIENYLAQRATNLQNRWYDATRLTAWAQLSPPAPQPLAADFGRVQLAAAGIDRPSAPSANTPLAATLVWQTPRGAESRESSSQAGSGSGSGSGTGSGTGSGSESGSEPGSESGSESGSEELALNVSLRLQDQDGHVWASREYARTLPASGAALTETVGLLVPVGLPPGGYAVAVSVQTADGEPLTLAGSDAVAAVIGNLEVTLPDTTGTSGGPDSGAPDSGAPGEISALRLPIAHALPQPVDAAGVRLLGYTGPDAQTPLLAGTELAATLFFAKRGETTAPVEIYLSLLDKQGNGVAGYEGWPLPGYPPAAWPEGALVQVPAAFNLPGALTTGSYRLAAGFRDPQTGEKTPPADLAEIALVQRPASFTRPAPARPFATPPQLGTHARLLGYEVAAADGAADGAQTRIRLYWEVLLPLLPPHHIFVHLDTPDGQTVAQADGPPMAVLAETAAASVPGAPATGTLATGTLATGTLATGNLATGNLATGNLATGNLATGNLAPGAAPTGSWQPGEFLITEHLLAVPVGEGEVLRVGLYDPHTQVRLPVTVDGAPAGDSVVLP